MPSTKGRCIPDQRPGAPPWEELRRVVIAWCESTRTDLVAQLATFEEGSAAWETVSGALEFCSEVPAISERSPDWSSAWESVSRASGGIPLFGGRRRQWRSLGRGQVMHCVVLGLQTGRLLDLELRLPRTGR